MRPTLYQYPKCSTCRKAIHFLRQRGVEVDSVDLVETPPSTTTIDGLASRAGRPVSRLFNTSGESYRSGGWASRLSTTSRADALSALAADGKLIKRPILDLGTKVLVGFDEAEWSAALQKRA
jgi:arsenate reductase